MTFSIVLYTHAVSGRPGWEEYFPRDPPRAAPVILPEYDLYHIGRVDMPLTFAVRERPYAGDHMKNDIQTRADIESLVDGFYGKVKKDPVIGYIFHDIAHVDWEKHLPVMYSFWETVLFANGGYAGNPMAVHMKLDSLSPLSPAHFERWYSLFCETVDQQFQGEMAERVKQRAYSIATIMQKRIISQ